MERHGRELNPRPLSREFNALTITVTPPSHNILCGVPKVVIKYTLVISEHICFLLLVFLFLHFLVVGSVRYIKLTHVGFRQHVN